jgi:ubiquinone/menaquinone biosynthesis C-methylase UbiE
MTANVEVSEQYNSMGEAYMTNMVTSAFPREAWARSRMFEFVGSLTGKVVCDAGCGNGLDTKSFLEKGALKILAFDPSELMLENARESVGQTNTIEFKKGTFEEIPFDSASSDIMIGVFSLHYPSDLDAAYSEIYRIMKPGGVITFVVTHPADMTLHKKSPFKGQEVVTFKIYNDQVLLEKPTHTLTEYFSPFFFKHFTLDNMEEYYPVDEGTGKEVKDPKLIAFSATKK